MRKKVTVMGGGTGTFIILSGLKKYNLDLASIITMMDSGGSTGKLRDQLGVLPPGDIRQSLVALSEASSLWRDLFLYRFEKGDLKGHNFGNIFLSALEKVSGDYNKVIELASYVLRTKGKVIPVTFDKVNLVVKYLSGKEIVGEGNIDSNKTELSGIKEISLDKNAAANPQAISRIKTSDLIVIGPGDLYTSIIPTLLPVGVKDALVRTSAKIVFVINLMTKLGQTTNFTAKDHVRELEKYLGREVDIVLMNNTRIPADIKRWYEEHSEKEVLDDLKSDNKHKIIRDNIIDRHPVSQNKADKLTRSVLRHSSYKLARLIRSIVYGRVS